MIPRTEEYQKEEEALEKEITKMRKHLEDHKPLFRTALEYGLMFSHHKHEYGDKSRGYSIGYAQGFSTVDSVYVDLYLGTEDSIIKDIGPILEELREHPRYKFYKDTEYIEMGWKGWLFAYTNGNKNPDNLAYLPHLLVRAWFEKSTKCRKVGTGEFKEIMKVECEE